MYSKTLENILKATGTLMCPCIESINNADINMLTLSNVII